MHQAAGDASRGCDEPRLNAVDKLHYATDGWVAPADALPPVLVAPLRAFATRFTAHPPRQELLSGIHNPFGLHVFSELAWSFLALAESEALLDAVAAVLGPDLVLWDSELYFDPAALPRDEGRYWPADPCAGTVVFVALDPGRIVLADVERLPANLSMLPLAAWPCYVLRYMPATSRYNRDPDFAANRRAAQERLLVNYLTRPIWLVRGEDRAGSDFATGFAPPAVRWAELAPWPDPDLVSMIPEAKGEMPCP